MERVLITGLILAGGRGTRMGGRDKGLVGFRGQPLVHTCIERLLPQVASVLVNANRNAAEYEAIAARPEFVSTMQTIACRVIPDRSPDFLGPLAGMLAGLHECQTPYLAICPVDSPLFPLDWVNRLAPFMECYEVAVVETMEVDTSGQSAWRSQPVFCLLHAALRPSLEAFLASGGRKVEAWTAQHRVKQVRFDQPEDALAFANANDLAALAALEDVGRSTKA